MDSYCDSVVFCTWFVPGFSEERTSFIYFYQLQFLVDCGDPIRSEVSKVLFCELQGGHWAGFIPTNFWWEFDSKYGD